MDDRTTLARLCQEIFGSNSNPNSGFPAPSTRKFLSELLDREGRDRIWPNEPNYENAEKARSGYWGRGLIGSHVSDLLRREGWSVRVLDNLEPQTHRNGKPPWIGSDVEFIEGDVADRETIASAMEDIDVVFHEAAYGGYMPEIAKYVYVNSFGTAQLLELIREKNLPIKKIIVASSQAVYSEGAATCPEHGLVFPESGRSTQLQHGDWNVHCPVCGAVTDNRSHSRTRAGRGKQFMG